MGDVLTDLIFLKRDSKFLTEKPYRLRYDPGGEFPRTNCETQVQKDVLVRDIRGSEAKYTLDRNGFQVLRMDSKLTPEEFNDRERVKEVYYEELRELLKRELGAKRVEILENGIRKRHEDFPISTGEDYEYLQPTSIIHIDFTSTAARAASSQILNVDSSTYSRMQTLNGDLYESSSAAELIEKFPWPEVVAFPNMLIESSKSKQLVTDAALSGPPDSPLLQEDNIILDQLWSRRCLPEEWSATDPSETTKNIGSKIRSRLQALRDEHDEKIQGCWSKELGSPMSSYAIPSTTDMSTRWNTKSTCSIRIPKSMVLPLGGLAVCLPCAAALLNGPNRPGSVRGIVGVISGSSGLSLTSLPTEEDYNALRWLVRILWAMTYVAFLRCSYLSIRDNRPIYLFCSLLLAAHFVFGFAGTAETTEEATKGITMLGPLVATLCAALVYIPFGYRNSNPSSGLNTSRSAEDVEIACNGGLSLAPAQHDDGDGDLSLGWRVMQGMMGPVV